MGSLWDPWTVLWVVILATSCPHSFINDLGFLHCIYLDSWFHRYAALSDTIKGTLVLLHIYCQPLIWFLSSGSPDDWECFLHYLGCLLEDDSSWCNGDPIHRSNPLDCKLALVANKFARYVCACVYVFFGRNHSWGGFVWFPFYSSTWTSPLVSVACKF